MNKNMNDDQVVFQVVFVKEEIQSFAEANFGRELTEEELNKFEDYIWDNDMVFSAKIELLAEAIEAVINFED